MIVYKDVVERYTIRNQSLLKHLIKYIFVNMGTLVSINKLYNEYKSQGFKIGKDTLIDYISYLQEAYTIFTTPIYRNSVREEQCNPKKLYAIEDEKTLQREIKALLKGMEYFKLGSSYLVAANRDETIEIDGKKIVVVPMWKWLLEG